MRRSTKYSLHFPPILFWIVLLLLPVCNAWGMHEGIPCAACHKLLPGGEDRPNASAVTSELSKDQVCLTCHDADRDRSNLNPPYELNGTTPLAAGSFTETLFSDGVGHNILHPDAVLGSMPPGGTAPLKNFGCLSCHDPHDNGNYRNLRTTIQGKSTLVRAVGDPNYRNNLYISGMDEFCSACHEYFHGETNTRESGEWVRHPTGIPLYGARHADFEGWSRRGSGLIQVEYPDGNPSDTYRARVFCLSCHYAHASRFQNSMRWENNRSNKGCLECHSLDDD